MAVRPSGANAWRFVAIHAMPPLFSASDPPLRLPTSRALVSSEHCSEQARRQRRGYRDIGGHVGPKSCPASPSAGSRVEGRPAAASQRAPSEQGSEKTSAFEV